MSSIDSSGGIGATVGGRGASELAAEQGLAAGPELRGQPEELEREIERVFGTTPGPDRVPTGVAVSPRMLLAMVARRMRGLDSQILDHINASDRETSEASRLSNELQQLEALREAANGNNNARLRLDGKNGEIPVEYQGRTYESAAQFIEEHELDLAVSGTHLQGEQLQSEIDQVKQEMQSLTSGNEMRMLSLQTLMQQRTELITLGSNLMKSLNDATSSVVANIRS